MRCLMQLKLNIMVVERVENETFPSHVTDYCENGIKIKCNKSHRARVNKTSHCDDSERGCEFYVELNYKLWIKFISVQAEGNLC